MSIWSSVGEPVMALDGHNEDANYRAEGTPTLAVDVATSGFHHDHIRIAIWDEPPDDGKRSVDVCALLSPAAIRSLIAHLEAAVS